MSLTVAAPAYVNQYVFGRKTIEKAIAGAFPNWQLVSIYECRRQGEVHWRQLVQGENHPDKLRDLVLDGYEQFQLFLTHAHGGEAYPDYWAWELGQEFAWKVGDYLEVDVNQGMRPASIIATLGDEALLEYEMPKGTTALWVIHRLYHDIRHIRNVSYRACPKKWLDAIEESGIPWTGNGQ
jgi:hypothetical protein